VPGFAAPNRPGPYGRLGKTPKTPREGPVLFYHTEPVGGERRPPGVGGGLESFFINSELPPGGGVGGGTMWAVRRGDISPTPGQDSRSRKKRKSKVGGYGQSSRRTRGRKKLRGRKRDRARVGTGGKVGTNLVLGTKKV